MTLRHLSWLDGPNGGWQPWEDLGGAIWDDQIAASCWRYGRWDAFGLGFGGGPLTPRTLEHWWFDSQGGFGTDMGGPVTRAAELSGWGLAVASWGEDRLDLFAFDMHLVLQHWWITYQPWGPPVEPDGNPTGGWTWHGPEAISAAVRPIASKISAVAPARDRLDVFWLGGSSRARDPTDTLVHMSWDGHSWQEEHVLPGIGNPIAVSWGPDRMDTFSLGSTEAMSGYSLWHHSWVSGQPLGPERLVNGVGAAPSTVSWGLNRLDVFYQGSDGQLMHEAYDTVMAPPPPPPPPLQPPPRTNRGHFDFLLNGSWEKFITAEAAQVYVAVLRPGGDPTTATHYPMTRGITGWAVSVPASSGGPGVWGFQCHVAGVFDDGSPSGDKWSPLWVYDWEARSPAAYITLNNDGSQPWDWSANVLNS